jgi:DNA-binding response OmpR family regulator
MKNKILVVEDLPNIYREIEKVLVAGGYEVELLRQLPQHPSDSAFQIIVNRSSEFAVIIWDNDIKGIYASRGYIQEFAKTYKGVMIACGSQQDEQISAGCNERCDSKSGQVLLKKINELLQN